jgi:hypothetical protein
VSRTLVPVIAGLASGIALLVTLSTIFTQISPQNDKAIICGESIENIKEKVRTSKSFAVLLPTNLPKGYSLQATDYIPNVEVAMQYFTRSLCNPDVPYSPEEGVIEIVEGPLSHLSDAKNGEEYVQREMSKYQASNINASSYSFQNGRLHAIGYWDESYLKASLWVIDDKTQTIVKIGARSSQTSLHQLVAIGESLKE